MLKFCLKFGGQFTVAQYRAYCWLCHTEISNFFIYEKCIPGVGHCIHTYEGDGSPLPSFKGEPFITPLFNNIKENAEFYWDNLNSLNKVSLMVKFITVGTLDTKIHIINTNG